MAGDETEAHVDDQITIVSIGGQWFVTSADIILARARTVPEALERAIQVAARTAGYGRSVQVLLEEPAGRTVVWDSTRDGFSRA